MHAEYGMHDRPSSKSTMLIRYLLNVVVSECAVVLELKAGKDETLLVRGDAFLVLDQTFGIGNAE